MTEVTTLVTPAMEEQQGTWCNEKVSPPVSESDIRRWAIASNWPETPPKLFWDAEHAASTHWGGIVAPEDFNPFAWPVPREAVDPASSLPGLRGGHIMNGGQTDTYGARMRPGDVIRSRLQLSHWEERQGKSSLMLFTYYRTEWTNQDDTLVKSRLATVIQF
jgi:N-terminal half of MaoC dehydratase